MHVSKTCRSRLKSHHRYLRSRESDVSRSVHGIFVGQPSIKALHQLDWLRATDRTKHTSPLLRTPSHCNEKESARETTLHFSRPSRASFQEASTSPKAPIILSWKTTKHPTYPLLQSRASNPAVSLAQALARTQNTHPLHTHYTPTPPTYTHPSHPAGPHPALLQPAAAIETYPLRAEGEPVRSHATTTVTTDTRTRPHSAQLSCRRLVSTWILLLPPNPRQTRVAVATSTKPACIPSPLPICPKIPRTTNALRHLTPTLASTDLTHSPPTTPQTGNRADRQVRARKGVNMEIIGHKHRRTQVWSSRLAWWETRRLARPA